MTDWALRAPGIAVDPGVRLQVGENLPLATYKARPPVSGDVPGATLTHRVGLGWNQSVHELTFREKAHLAVASGEPKSADELNGHYVYPLQNLMTFVCDRAQEVEWFSVKEKAAGARPAENPDIRVIGPRVQPDEEADAKKPVRRHQMLFTLEDVDFSTFVGKWLRLGDRYADACNVFFGLKYGPPAYIDMTFLAVAQCLCLYYARREDGLSRRAEEERRLKAIVSVLAPADAEWVIDHVGPRPHPPLERVLHELVGEHGAVMAALVSKRHDRFINTVINTLHYEIHREPEVRLAASHGADLYWMTEKLRFLIKACFLSELDFSEEEILAFFQRNALNQHMCQLEAERESGRGAAS